HLLAEYRQFLPKIEPVRQLGDRFLSLRDLLPGSGPGQPLGESLLSGPGAGQTQQLEQRAGTEDIQIKGVQVPFFQVGLPGGSPAHPGPVQTTKGLLVMSQRPLKGFLAPLQSLVIHDKADKCPRRNQEPGERQVPKESECQKDKKGNKGQE